MAYLLQGFLLGLAYVAPIGMQNMFVINTAATQTRLRALKVALTTVFFDVALAVACFFGVGLLIDRLQLLKFLIMGIGSCAVIYIGISLVRSIPVLDASVDTNKPYFEIIWACFAVTWLNPQAIIDGSLLLGGFKASLPIESAYLFIAGVCLASGTWFLGLSTLVSTAKHIINERALRVINIVCGGIIILYGLKLGYSFLQLVI
ncbi:MAG: LysE family transporter [Clostridia bacterium]|nr:LysE family transporter [Clostridia bacterium]